MGRLISYFNFSFGHIDFMQDVIKGIIKLLKDDGIFVFEIYYLVI